MVSLEGAASTTLTCPTNHGPLSSAGPINGKASARASTQRLSKVMAPSISPSSAAERAAAALVVPACGLVNVFGYRIRWVRRPGAGTIDHAGPMHRWTACQCRRMGFPLFGHGARTKSLPRLEGRVQQTDELSPTGWLRRHLRLYCLLRLLSLRASGFSKGVAAFLDQPSGARSCRRILTSGGADPLAALALIIPIRGLAVGDAVGELSVMSYMMTVTVATPWGLHPVAGLSCDAAAASCWGADAGDAGTVPPPRFLLIGRVTRARLCSATRRLHPPQVLDGHNLRISRSLP